MSPILGIYASQISGHLSNFYSIQTVTVGSGGASSISFSSIPSTYTHLQIRAIGRNTYSTNFSSYQIQFNGDSASNYSWHYIYGDGSSAIAGASTSDTLMREINFASASLSANIFSASITDIFDYTNVNKNKTIRTLGGADANGSGAVNLASGAWYSSSAITSISLTPSNSGTFAQYTQFALYGVK